MLASFLLSPLKIPYPISLPPVHQPTHFHFLVLAFPYTGALSLHKTKGFSSHWWLTRPSSATYPTRDTVLGILVSSYCSSPYRVADPFGSLGSFSSSIIRGSVCHPIDDCEHPLLYLPGTGTAWQEIAISRSCQQNLAGLCNSVCVWWLYMGWIPRWGSLWMVHPFVSAPNFVSVTPSMGVLFPILRRGEVSTFWSSFFLSFMCFANCMLGILSFWANIHLSVSAYQVTSFVMGLPH